MDTEDWKVYREAQKKRRAERVIIRRRQILGLRKLGYEVQQLTPYQYRINGEIDVYPVHNRFCKLCYRRWGNYRDVEELVKRTIKLNEHENEES